MISIIAAVAKNGVIGKEGKLPWHLPADLKNFYKLTVGHTVVMGRKTFESIGKPLSKRKNVVLTRDSRYRPEGCQVANSVDEVRRLSKDGEVWIIGGGSLYKEFLPVADRLYLTKIAAVVDGDARFPTYDPNDWVEEEVKHFASDRDNVYDFDVVCYIRKSKN